MAHSYILDTINTIAKHNSTTNLKSIILVLKIISERSYPLGIKRKLIFLVNTVHSGSSSLDTKFN